MYVRKIKAIIHIVFSEEEIFVEVLTSNIAETIKIKIAIIPIINKVSENFECVNFRYTLTIVINILIMKLIFTTVPNFIFIVLGLFNGNPKVKYTLFPKCNASIFSIVREMFNRNHVWLAVLYV